VDRLHLVHSPLWKWFVSCFSISFRATRSAQPRSSNSWAAKVKRSSGHPCDPHSAHHHPLPFGEVQLGQGKVGLLHQPHGFRLPGSLTGAGRLLPSGLRLIDWEVRISLCARG
jgi:hypothetical protein